jgi:hypothetical protein
MRRPSDHASPTVSTTIEQSVYIHNPVGKATYLVRELFAPLTTPYAGDASWLRLGRRVAPRTVITTAHCIGRRTMADSTPKRSTYTEYWRDRIEDFDSIYLIRSAEHYVIWIDNDGDIDWMTTNEYDERGAEDRQKHNAILSNGAVLECAPCHGLTGEAKRHFKRLVGEALAYNFEDDYQTAQQMLNEARAYIRARSEETSRRWYVSASTIMTAIMIVLGLMIWIWRTPITTELTANFVWISIAAVAGSCGALLSVIWRSGQLKVDSSAGEALHYVEGASRVWAGALSGVLVMLAVKSEFILAPLTRSGNTLTVMMLAAFVAGAGERLATSIISTFESTHLPPTKRRDNDQGSGDNNA